MIMPTHPTIEAADEALDIQRLAPDDNVIFR